MQKNLIDSVLEKTDIEEGDVCLGTISDIHLMNNWSYGKYNSIGMNTDLETKIFIMKEFIDVCGYLKCPFIVGGDLLDQKFVDAVTSTAAAEIISYAQRNSNIPEFIILRGNHECYDSNADFSSLDQYKYFCKPFAKRKGIVACHPRIDNINSQNKKFFIVSIPANQKAEEHLEKNILNFSNKRKNNEFINSDYRILLFHGAIQGADLGSMQAPSGVKPELIQQASDKFDWVICGDFHKFQYVNNHKNVYYCGSPVQMNKGDAKNKRGYQILNLTKGTLNFIKSKAPTFKNIEYVFGKYIHPWIKNPEKYKENIQNKIITIKFSGKSEELAKVNFEEIKSKLMLNGAYNVEKGDTDIISEKRNSLKISHNLSYQEILHKYVESKDYDSPKNIKSHLKILKKFAKEAYYDR